MAASGKSSAWRAPSSRSACNGNLRRRAGRFACAMPKMRRKADLPTKDCAVCGRPFVWRRKWAKVWEEVRYCSDACRARRSTAPRVTAA